MSTDPLEALVTESDPDDDGRRSSRGRRGRTVLGAAIGVGAAFVILAVVLATRLGDGPPGYQGTALLGDPVPALELPTLEGDETLALGGQRGDALIVNFFNSWCVPCKEEEPALKAFYERHRDDPDFAFVGIVRDDTERAIRDWARDRAIQWPVLLDPGARASVEFATQGQPETFAITPDGVVAAIHRGAATTDDLEALLAIARGDAGTETGAAP